MIDATLPLEILLKKRDGKELTSTEIGAFVRAVVRSNDPAHPPPVPGSQDFITDAQIASFLMAVFQRGLSPRELADLTQAMRFSGEVFDNSSLGGFTVDKHSTGGVGDKTSLLIAPIVAAARSGDAAPILVPMISGRSLGHTGGTLDKLETIPGFNTQLPISRMVEVLRECHAVLVGQTPALVPADRILYALRDHTGTVESPYLITASIMSKKLAEDLRGLVLDVKVGSGAFMPTYEASRDLAKLLVATGQRAGTRTVALLTSMDEPLGRFAGNWVEVQECVEILQGKTHPGSRRLFELSMILSGYMLHLAGHAADADAGRAQAEELVQNGQAYQAWLRIVRAQGGDTRVFDDPAAFHRPGASVVVRAPKPGYLAAMDCRQVGWAVQRLGAGRTRPGVPVSAHAGLEVHARIGDPLQQDQPLFTLFADRAELLTEPQRMIIGALHIGPEPVKAPRLVHEVIQA